MRKLTIFIIYCLFCMPHYSQAGMMILSHPEEAVTGECDACTDTEADVLCEDFEGSETITNDGSNAICSGWTANESGSNVVSLTSHTGTFNCTNKGSYALSIVADFETANNCNIYKTFTEKGNIYGELYFYFNSWAIEDNEYVQLISFMDGATPILNIRYRKQPSSTLILAFSYRKNDNTLTGANGSTNFTNGTWHKLEWRFLASTGEVDVWLDGGSELDVADGDQDNLIDRVYVGPGTYNSGVEADDDIDMEMDIIRTDDDTAIPDCTGWGG